MKILNIIRTQRHYLKDMFWTYLENIVRLSTTFAVGIYVARYLGPHQYGLFNYSISFIGFFSMFASLGLGAIVVRELVESKTEHNTILGTVFVLKISGTIVALIFLSLALQFNNNSPTECLFIYTLSCGLFIDSHNNVLKSYFESKALMRCTAIATFTATVIVSCLKILLVFLCKDLIYFIALNVSNHVIIAVVLIAFYHKKGGNMLAWRFKFTTAIFFLNSTFFLLFGNLASLVFIQIDQIMLKEIVDATANGYYSLATRFINLWYFLPMIITKSIFPAIIKVKKESETLFNIRIQQWLDFSGILGTAIAVFMGMISPLLISTILGNKYTETGAILQIYAWTAPFMLISMPVSKALLTQNILHISFIRHLLGATINIALNFLWIPIGGGKGAALASVVSMMIAYYFSNLLFASTRKYFWMQTKALLLINTPSNLKRLFSRNRH